MRTPKQLEQRRVSRLDVFRGHRLAPGRYRIGTFEIIHAAHDRWEVWDKASALHAFPTKREAVEFCRAEA